MRNAFLSLLLLLTLFSCKSSNYIKEIIGKWDLYESQYIESDSLTGDLTGKFNFAGHSMDLSNNRVYLYGSIQKKIAVTPGENYTLYISGILSSSKIWIDGELLGVYGDIGRSLEESKPLITRSLINFVPNGWSSTVTIEFANFHLKTKKMFNWIVYGESQEILDLYIKNQSKDYFATGVLIVNGILFMLLFLSNRGNKPYIYLSLFTLSYGIRSFLLKNTVIQFIYPNFSWELIFQLLKSNELWALAFIILFFRALYPKEFTNKISNIIVYTTVFFSFLVYIPVEYYYQYNFLLTSQIMVIVSGVYILGNLFIAILHKRSLAKRSLFSLTIFFSSIIVDIAANKQFVIFEYYSAQFVILVVLIMFIFIGKERSLTYLRSQLQLKHNRDLKEVFSRFVPFDILKNIGNIDLKDRPPGDFVVKPYTIAYIDIRDFTKLSEGLTPQENFSMINNFYQIVGLAVSSHGGFIESYGGDGVKALFPKSPDDAINTALRISDEVALTSKIKIGISIHFGPIILGTVGSTNRIQATAISDVTRILESMDHFNSKMGIEILISRSVLSLSTLGMNKLLNLGRVILKNEEEDIEVFQVIPDNYHIDELFKEAFDNGVLMVQNKKYSKAYGYFLLANRYQPSHQLTQYYVKKFEMFLKLKGFHFTLKI